MQLPFAKKRRGVLPGGRPRIDWRNPITNGLLYCYLPRASGGKTVYNLTGLGCDLNGDTAYKTVMTPDGLAGYGDANATDLISSYSPIVTPTTAATCFWRGINLGFDLGDKPMIGISTPNQSPYRSVTISIFSFKDYLLYWTATDSITHKSADYRPSDTNYITNFAGTFQTGGNCVTYLNGTQRTSASYGSSLPLKFDSTSRVMMGAASNTSGRSGVNSLMGCIWNRVLTPAEIVSLNLFPYQFLIYREDEVFAEIIGLSTFATNQPHKHGVAG